MDKIHPQVNYAAQPAKMGDLRSTILNPAKWNQSGELLFQEEVGVSPVRYNLFELDRGEALEDGSTSAHLLMDLLLWVYAWPLPMHHLSISTDRSAAV